MDAIKAIGFLSSLVTLLLGHADLGQTDRQPGQAGDTETMATTASDIAGVWEPTTTSLVVQERLAFIEGFLSAGVNAFEMQGRSEEEAITDAFKRLDQMDLSRVEIPETRPRLWMREDGTFVLTNDQQERIHGSWRIGEDGGLSLDVDGASGRFSMTGLSGDAGREPKLVGGRGALFVPGSGDATAYTWRQRSTNR